MTEHKQNRVPLTGYSDRLSARPGDTVEFKVSASEYTEEVPGEIKSWLVQSICADANPAGPGIVERSAREWYEDAEHSVYMQAVNAGSYGVTTPVNIASNPACVQISATFLPTHLNGARQCIMALGSYQLFIDEQCRISVSLGDQQLSSSAPLVERQWLHVSACLHRVQAQASSTERLSLTLCVNSVPDATTQSVNRSADNPLLEKTTLTNLPLTLVSSWFTSSPVIIIAASSQSGQTVDHFNGKIESPEVRITYDHESTDSTDKTLAWDFSVDMNRCCLQDVDQHGVALNLVNFPARAMKGSRWSGNEMCWRHAPAQYAAIHFHDDDLVNAGWQTTFTYTLPADMPSGIYVMRISDGTHEDAMPFFVCAPKGQAQHRVCVLVSTFTYAIYGNHARPDWQASWQDKVRNWDAYPYNPAQYPGYGLSTYNNHSDGSGICHASHLRPLFNLRPGYITFGNTQCSGLRHFQADSHLIAWLNAMDIGFDVVTDQQLHDEGVGAIASYDMLMTGSHPEYHTAQTLNALQHYRDSGGHLSYLGGNGFYWRIALHPEHPDTLEIRRAEAGIRAWAAEPGEYYHAFDGQYGGLWRRNGRPPQALVGLGFSAQGQFNGSHYRRCNTDPHFEWVFKGIDGDIIGDAGLSGMGAAGFELDRADSRLGTPNDAVILASSEAHSDDFILVPEEMLTHLTTLPGPSADQLIRADIIWFEVPGGGSVFAVGSITFCGSLPCNNYDNSVSQLLKNVVDHVLTSDPA